MPIHFSHDANTPSPMMTKKYQQLLPIRIKQFNAIFPWSRGLVSNLVSRAYSPNIKTCLVFAIFEDGEIAWEAPYACSVDMVYMADCIVKVADCVEIRLNRLWLELVHARVECSACSELRGNYYPNTIIQNLPILLRQLLQSPHRSNRLIYVSPPPEFKLLIFYNTSQ